MTREEYEKKVALITELHGMRGDHTSQVMLKICDLMIQDLREDNDTADKDVVRLNQGGIEAWKAMKQFIEKGASRILVPQKEVKK